MVLTHAFSPTTLYWPTSERFQLDKVFAETTDKGFHYEANRFQSSEDGGTHMDAPSHFLADDLSVDQFRLMS